jgi:5-formyltetrahydrofolate cyclo-ligase
MPTEEGARDDRRHHKKLVRRRVLERRDRLSTEQQERLSASIRERFVALPEVLAANTVMCFVSFGGEVLTRPIIDWCLAEGKRVAVPKVIAPRRMDAFRVTDLATDLAPGAYGIDEPRGDLGLGQVSADEIDLVVVPGCAFDRSGHRVGYGGGFYDTYLPRLRRDVPRVAVAFELQIVDDVPRERHDLRVDVLVTETGVLRFDRRSRAT